MQIKEDFNQSKEILRAILGVAGIVGPQRAYFLHLHLKGYALSFFQQLAASVEVDLDRGLAAKPRRFVNLGLQ